MGITFYNQVAPFTKLLNCSLWRTGVQVILCCQTPVGTQKNWTVPSHLLNQRNSFEWQKCTPFETFKQYSPDMCSCWNTSSPCFCIFVGATCVYVIDHWYSHCTAMKNSQYRKRNVSLQYQLVDVHGWDSPTLKLLDEKSVTTQLGESQPRLKLLTSHILSFLLLLMCAKL
jgi:hypothetical protein